MVPRYLLRKLVEGGSHGIAVSGPMTFVEEASWYEDSRLLMWRSRTSEVRRFEIINIQQYCRSDEAAPEQSAQCVVVARSSLPLGKMLHADALIVAGTANVGNPSNGLHKYDTVGDGIVQVVTCIGKRHRRLM